MTDDVAVVPGKAVDAVHTPVVIGTVTADNNSLPRQRMPPGVEPGPTLNKFCGDVAVNWSRVKDNILSLDRNGREGGFLARMPLGPPAGFLPDVCLRPLRCCFGRCLPTETDSPFN